MAETFKYAIVQWEDQFTSVVNLENVKLPRKPVQEYLEGEFITAIFGKKRYRARISEISDDRSALMVKKGKNGVFPLKFAYQDNMDPELGQAAESTVKLSQEADVSDTIRNNSVFDTEREEMEIQQDIQPDIQPEIQPDIQPEIQPDIQPEIQPDIQPVILEDMEVEGKEQHSKKDLSNFRPSGSRRLEKRVEHLEKEVKDLRSSLKSLKRKFSEFSGGQSSRPATAEDSSSSNALTSTSSTASSSTLTVDSLLQSIQHIGNTEKDITECMRRISLTVFTRQDLVLCSRTGKKTFHSPGTARPPLDQDKLNLVEQVLISKFAISRETFKKKFDNLVKMERRSSSKTGDQEKN